MLSTDAVSFAYAKHGAGPPVVLVPGSGGWPLTFSELLPKLAVDHTVYAVDPPGQGGTRVTDPVFSYDVDAVATSLAAFLAGLGLGSAAIVGHSWGGGFALRLAQLFPERVDRLALLAPAGIDVKDVWEFRALRLPLVGELATRLTTTASIRHLLAKSFAHRDRMPDRELMVEAARALRSGPDAAGLRRDLLRIERGVNWRATERGLPRVQGPVTIVWGGDDRFFPVSLLPRFTRHLADADVHVIPGAGHSVHDDRPNEVLPILSAFLQGKPRPDSLISRGET